MDSDNSEVRVMRVQKGNFIYSTFDGGCFGPGGSGKLSAVSYQMSDGSR